MTNFLENFVSAVWYLAHSPLFIFLAVLAVWVGVAFIVVALRDQRRV